MEDNEQEHPQQPGSPGDLRGTRSTQGGRAALHGRPRVGIPSPEFRGTSQARGNSTEPAMTRSTDTTLTNMGRGDQDAPLGDTGPSTATHPVRTGTGQARRRRKEGGRKPFIWIATFNLRGVGSSRLADANKLNQISRIMGQEKLALLAVQETHECTNAFEALQRSNPNVWCFPNPGTRHSAGTGFIVRRDKAPPNLTKEDITHRVIEPGRADMLTLKWGNEQLTFLNVYAPNDEGNAVEFFESLVADLRRNPPDVILGDWNHVEDKMDRLPKRQPSTRIVNCLGMLKRALRVEDGWRQDHPNAAEFTWTSTRENRDGTTSKSRLDRILSSHELSNRTLERQTIGPYGLSDHSIVAAKIHEASHPFIGDPRWRMNLEDLEDKIAMNGIEEILRSCEKKIKKGKDPMTVWLNAKIAIRNLITDRQTMRRRERGKHLTKLKEDKTNLQRRKDFHTNTGLQLRVLAIEARIDEIKRAKLNRAAEYSAARYASKGEAVNKYWFSIGKALKQDSVIRALRDGSGQIRTDTDAMAKIATEHHANHQAKQPFTEARCEAIMRMSATTSGKRATSEAKRALDRDFNLQDVEDAICRSATGKAPGADGIPYEFYKSWLKRLRESEEDKKPPDIRWILMKVWNATRRGKTDERYVLGLMFLMYKKKDKLDIQNYRPITLLNTDYKLQTGAMASELGKHVHNMLHPDQAGFVPGRDIMDHVKLADLITTACEVDEVDGCLVALDQEKAYDKIDHEYLWQILEAYAIPNSWIRTVRNLYEAAETSVMVNQVTPTPFKVERGVRQGDPLSCLLFDLAIEPLAESIRRSSLKGIRIEGAVERLIVHLFADDTQLYLSKSDKWTDVLRITSDWCLASTAKFNQEKTEFLPLGTKSYRKSVQQMRTLQPTRIRTSEIFPRGSRMVKDGEPLRILGGHIGYDLDQNQIWEPVITKIEDLADKWSNRHLTMKGRKLVCSFLIQSRAQYLMMTNDPPQEIIQRVEKATHKVIWKGKKRGLTKMQELYKPVDFGGWGVPSFKDKTVAARLTWAKKWSAPLDERPLWADIADRIIVKTSKKPDEATRTSTLTQRWEEKKGYKSKLPKSLRNMLADVRKYRVKIDAQAFSAYAIDQAPVWMSKMMDTTDAEERRSAMKHLRTYHRVENLRDVRRLAQQNNERCPKHRECARALDAIAPKAKRKFDYRFTTPVITETGLKDNLDHTTVRMKTNRDRWKANESFILDPRVKHKGDIRGATRIFTRPGSENLLPAFRIPKAADETNRIIIYTDGSATDIGTPTARAGAGIWCEDEDLNLTRAIRVTGLPQTNNRGELTAVTWALKNAPKDRAIEIRSDSTYVVNGLANTHKTWEDQGWMGVENADLWRIAMQEARMRNATTTIQKVKAHSRIIGNEEADRLAKEGSEAPASGELTLTEPPEWQVSGLRLSALPFKKIYEGNSTGSPLRTGLYGVALEATLCDGK
ncbi:hypothetical protein FRC01_014236 [Tulasnella sp. 417]|nr:hypothetical protein FRC01_014236 [Tulasnella sp. 417]